MSGEANEKLEEYKAKCKTDGESLVKYEFPKRVLELNDMLKSDRFDLEKLAEIVPEINIPVPDAIVLNNGSSEALSKKRKLEAITNDSDKPAGTKRQAVGEDDLPSGTKVMSLPGGTVPTCSYVTFLVDLIKPKIRDVIDHAGQIKMWLAYSIPKIEDGNNFGVGVQEDTLAEARQVETEAATFLDQISRYYLTRGKLISRIAKYPHIADLRRSVQEVDEKQALTMRLIVCELRNQYASLHDMIMKNLDKIKKPRSANADNMY